MATCPRPQRKRTRHASDPQRPPVGGRLPRPRSAQDDTTFSPRPEAKIVPGDIVRLNIWREPDLTGEFLVQEDGLAVLPRIGPVRVVDDTPSSLKTRLVAEYEKTLINRSIEVIVLRRILITGEVGGEGV